MESQGFLNYAFLPPLYTYDYNLDYVSYLIRPSPRLRHGICDDMGVAYDHYYNFFISLSM